MPELECSEACAVAVGWAPGFEKLARMFAQQHQLPIINELPCWRGLCFYLDGSGWSIRDRGDQHQKPFALTFVPRYAAQGKDPLIKAMGKAKTVLDLTAGWANDAVHIALSGRMVVAVERSPVVFKMLEQARKGLNDKELANNLNFIHRDAAAAEFPEWLDQQMVSRQEVELVYLDPMFADKPLKTAKAKKPMAVLQCLLDAPSDTNENRLFENALDIAKKRVVVKRALKAPYIMNRIPQGSIKSKLLRFDLYTPNIR